MLTKIKNDKNAEYTESNSNNDYDDSRTQRKYRLTATYLFNKVELNKKFVKTTRREKNCIESSV